MRLQLIVTLVAAAALLLPGCRSDLGDGEKGPAIGHGTPTSMSPPTTVPGEPGDEAREAAAAAVTPAAAERALETTTYVAVAPTGTTFEPPVDVTKLPPGSWYCGTEAVHYAVMAEGQGTCPVCKAPLAHAEAPKPTDRAAANP